MIRVSLAAEPLRFNADVRIPGNVYLNSLAVGEVPKFKGHEYWRRTLLNLRSAYQDICAYTCHWISSDTGSDTVEHFIPTSVAPAQAYEWSNYRLVCMRLNGRKSDHQDVVDPFLVTDQMFIIQFPSLLILPGPSISGVELALAVTTITRLKLNENRCITARLEWLMPYVDGTYDLQFLRTKAPFLASEISRNQFTRTKLKKLMKTTN